MSFWCLPAHAKLYQLDAVQEICYSLGVLRRSGTVEKRSQLFLGVSSSFCFVQSWADLDKRPSFVFGLHNLLSPGLNSAVSLSKDSINWYKFHVPVGDSVLVRVPIAASVAMQPRWQCSSSTWTPVRPSVVWVVTLHWKLSCSSESSVSNALVTDILSSQNPHETRHRNWPPPLQVWGHLVIHQSDHEQILTNKRLYSDTYAGYSWCQDCTLGLSQDAPNYICKGFIMAKLTRLVVSAFMQPGAKSHSDTLPAYVQSGTHATHTQESTHPSHVLRGKQTCLQKWKCGLLSYVNKIG